MSASDLVAKSADLRAPDELSAVAATLASRNHEAWIVGETVHRLLCGHAPSAFELATSATVEQNLDLFPSAIPTHPQHGVVTVPGGSAPIDLIAQPAHRTVVGDLDHRDFTIFALAWSPVTGEILDPHGGRRDLQAGLLRAVGNAAERLREDPARALRAARIVAEHDYQVDPALEQALSRAAGSLRVVPPERKRRELVKLLMAPHAGAGLRLLRRTGLEARLVRYVREDAAELVEQVPLVLSFRMAAWLRGTRPAGMLRRLRFGRLRFDHIERLLDHHPLDEQVSPTIDRQLSRLQRKLTMDDLEMLFGMREWELARAAEAGSSVDRELARLAAVRNGIDRVRSNQRHTRRRESLAIDGKTVMEVLACGPGPRVGSALRFLSERVAADPSCNTLAALRADLALWTRRNPDPRQQPDE